MRTARAFWGRGRALICVFPVMWIMACGIDDLLTSSDDAAIVVRSADPDTVTIDTVVNVRLFGRGFTEGSVAEWTIGNQVAAGITTLGTTFESDSTLLAQIRISSAAALRSYRIRVRSRKGKKGIGAETFRLVAKPVRLPEPGVRSEVSDVNDSGVIVGTSFDAAGVLSAVRWSHNGSEWTYSVLGPGSAIGINSVGMIVRRLYDQTSRKFRSLIHTPAGSILDLGDVYVNGINDAGTLIGSVRDSLGKFEYVVWRQVSPTLWGSPEVLPAATGYRNSDLLSISNNGDIAGHVYDSKRMEWAAVWRYNNGQWSAPVLVDPIVPGAALAINDLGAVAGAIWPCIPGPGCQSAPASWPSVGGRRRILPTLYNTFGYVHGMNNAGQVVGYAQVHYNDGSGPLAVMVNHPVMWFPAGSAAEDLGAILANQTGEARAINNRGVIVGTVRDEEFRSHAIVWNLQSQLVVAALIPPA